MCIVGPQELGNRPDRFLARTIYNPLNQAFSFIKFCLKKLVVVCMCRLAYLYYLLILFTTAGTSQVIGWKTGFFAPVKWLAARFSLIWPILCRAGGMLNPTLSICLLMIKDYINEFLISNCLIDVLTCIIVVCVVLKVMLIISVDATATVRVVPLCFQVVCPASWKFIDTTSY